MTSETWRVVLADGSVREVEVRAMHDDSHRASFLSASAYGRDPLAAVLRLAASALDAAVEILAPGEPTRAEAVASARGRDAVAAERERCAVWCDEVAAEPVADEWDDDAEAYRRGRRAGARECAGRIRAGGV